MKFAQWWSACLTSSNERRPKPHFSLIFVTSRIYRWRKLHYRSCSRRLWVLECKTKSCTLFGMAGEEEEEDLYIREHSYSVAILNKRSWYGAMTRVISHLHMLVGIPLFSYGVRSKSCAQVSVARAHSNLEAMSSY